MPHRLQPMNILQILKQRTVVVKNSIAAASLPKKLLLFALIMAAGFGVWHFAHTSHSAPITYETATVEKGTLVTSISGTGTITSGNNTAITTRSSGVVSKVYVTNGDTVKKGQKIADITLDDYAKERQTKAYAEYLDAQEAVKAAVNAKAEADLQMWKDRDAITKASDAIDEKNNTAINPTTQEEYTVAEKTIIDKTLETAKTSFETSELQYKNADSEIAAASAKVNSALRTYQENSATIVAPAAGIVSDLALAPGLTVTASSTTSNTSGATIVSAQTVGKIGDPKGQLIATVNLSEIDITSVKANQKASIILDAFPDKTFTGKVLSVDTSGSVSSGVTSYPVKIILDQTEIAIYSNMAVTVDIITDVKSDVLLIPTSAITTSNGQSSVQVKKDDEVSTVTVEIGSANDSQSEIVSGLAEGDEVVTSVTSPTVNTKSSSTETSPFSGVGGSFSGNRSFSVGMTGAGGPPPGGL